VRIVLYREKSTWRQKDASLQISHGDDAEAAYMLRIIYSACVTRIYKGNKAYRVRRMQTSVPLHISFWDSRFTDVKLTLLLRSTITHPAKHEQPSCRTPVKPFPFAQLQARSVELTAKQPRPKPRSGGAMSTSPAATHFDSS
jgi:hypothetical protein